MLNEKIKYCKKPVECVFDDIALKEEKKTMKCIAQLSSKCRKFLRTTKERRICEICSRIVKDRT